MTTWLLIFAMGIVTYAVRALPLLAPWGHTHPAVERTLRHLPPAIFAALIVASLSASVGQGVGPVSTLVGVTVGALVAWRTANVSLTIVAGLSAFWLAR